MLFRSDTSTKPKKVKKNPFHNKKLQVIVKIVRIKFDKTNELEGAWHVEGMSHEHIVATASCTLAQTTNFNAELKFKRRYTTQEVEDIRDDTPSDHSQQLDKFLNFGMIPLGKVNIKPCSAILFPNSHIHKVDMKGKGSKQERLLLVFWLINPNVRIMSTKDINQQKYSLKEAYKVRLDLMKERTDRKSTRLNSSHSSASRMPSSA